MFCAKDVLCTEKLDRVSDRDGRDIENDREMSKHSQMTVIYSFLFFLLKDHIWIRVLVLMR